MISAELDGAGFDVRASEVIRQDMWEKWMDVSTIAGITCLMRASIGDIIAAHGGQSAILRLFGENCGLVTAAGFTPRPKFIEEEMT